jgi:hypothetical protein
MGVVKPASFKAGRRISFGEPVATLAAPALVKGVNHVTAGTWAVNTYFWVVAAYGQDWESPVSNEVTAVMIETGSIDFTWDVVPGAVGYRLYRGLTSGEQNKRVVTIADGAATSYTDLGNAGTSDSPGPYPSDNFVKVYEPGDLIPNGTVKGIKHLSALLGNRSIIPNLDPFRRKGKSFRPTPTDVSPSMKRTL